MKFSEKLRKMKSGLKIFALLCVLCASVVKCSSLDREAFTFTNYELSLQIDPDLQRLGVRGKITLRNDSQTPQKIAVLQVSSSLGWRSIKAAGKQVQFVTQTYTSDIDHTGALSEAIVTLPEAIAPKGTIDMQIAYEGVIALDATRLTRIGTPDAVATGTDWDQISGKFTAVRGVGYVAWYPAASEAASLSEGNSVFDALGRWRAREAVAKMHLEFAIPRDDDTAAELLVTAAMCPLTSAEIAHQLNTDCTYETLGSAVPGFVIAGYQEVERPNITVHYLRGHDTAAGNYADAAEAVEPLVSDWFGKPREKAIIADLPDPAAAPFESGSLLLTPLAGADPKLAGLAAAHQLTHASFRSFRPWIEEGLAHFAQALYLEQQKGRQAALDYMGLHRSGFSEAEKQTAAPRSEDEANRSLANTTSEELYRSKAMYVWWMLRDMIGDAAFKKALASYRPEQDKDSSYMPRLVAAQTQRDLGWFFDDWVYHDRGLPDFKVESAFSRKATTNEFLLTITVDNLGGAGAEVPLVVKFNGGEVRKRLEVRARSKASIRVEVPGVPQEIVANDGSVPESDMTNNVFKVENDGSSPNSQP